MSLKVEYQLQFSKQALLIFAIYLKVYWQLPTAPQVLRITFVRISRYEMYHLEIVSETR